LIILSNLSAVVKSGISLDFKIPGLDSKVGMEFLLDSFDLFNILTAILNSSFNKNKVAEGWITC